MITRSELLSGYKFLPITFSTLFKTCNCRLKKYQVMLQDHYLPDGCPVFKNVHFSQHIYNIRTWIQSKKMTSQNKCHSNFQNLYNYNFVIIVHFEPRCENLAVIESLQYWRFEITINYFIRVHELFIILQINLLKGELRIENLLVILIERAVFSLNTQTETGISLGLMGHLAHF